MYKTTHCVQMYCDLMVISKEKLHQIHVYVIKRTPPKVLFPFFSRSCRLRQSIAFILA